MIAFFRHYAKGFIWLIVTAFVVATFLGSASIFMLLDQSDQQRARGIDPITGEPTGATSPETRDPRLSSTKVMAEIELDGQKSIITEGELETRFRQTELARGQRMAEDARKFLMPMILDRMVEERLILLQAEASAVDVSARVEEQLASIWSQVGKAEYLRRTGQDEAELRRVLTQGFKLETMLEKVRKGRSIPEAEVEAYYRAHLAEFKAEGAAEPRPMAEVRGTIEEKLRAEIRPEHVKEYYEAHKRRWQLPKVARILHLAVDPRSEKRSAQATPSAEAVEAWYQEHKDEYRERERVDFSHLFVDPRHPDLDAASAPSDEEVQRYYDLNRDDFAREETRRVSQMVFEGPEADKLAEQARDRLGKGEPFAQVAKDASHDLSTRDQGGDMGWMASLDLASELSDLAFTLPVGRISDAIRVGGKVHLLTVTARKEPEQKPLSEVRADIVKELRQDKAWELAKTRAEELLDQAKAKAPAGTQVETDDEGVRSFPVTEEVFAGLVRASSHAASASAAGRIGEVILGENRPSTLLDEVGTQGFLDFAIQKVLRDAKSGTVLGPVRSFRGHHLIYVHAKPEPGARPLAEVRDQVVKAVQKAEIDRAVKTVLDKVRSDCSRGGVEASGAGDPAAAEKCFRDAIAAHSDSADKKELSGDWGEVALDPLKPPQLPNEVKAEVVSWNGLSRRIVEAVKNLGPGQVSQPVDLSGFRHLFFVAGVLPETFRPQAEVEDQIRQALNPTVSDEEARSFFDSNSKDFQTETGGDEVFHALFSSRQDAEEALAGIRSGAQSFEDVVRGPGNMDRVTAKDGGRIKGEISVPSIRTAVEAAAPDTLISEPLESPIGWHLVRVGAKKKSVEAKFEDVAAKVRERLLAEKRRQTEREWVSELRARARIETKLEAQANPFASLMGGLGAGG